MVTAYAWRAMVVLTVALALVVVVLVPRQCSAEELAADMVKALIDEVLAPPLVDPPVPDDEWTADTKLWLARSLVGEVGWRRLGEYGAVAWVYATRAKLSPNHTFTEMVKTYSAAIKLSGKRRNPWLFELDETGVRPKSWPVNEQGVGPLWRGLHDKAWFEALDFVDDWRAGKVPNPCPRANHFGGAIDAHRAVQQRWVQVKCSVPTRNRFYDSHRLTSLVACR